MTRLRPGDRIYYPLPVGKGPGTLVRHGKDGKERWIEAKFDLDNLLVRLPRKGIQAFDEDREPDSFGLTVLDYAGVIDRARRRFGKEIGWGSHRIVFRDGPEVVKVPFRISGIDANTYEASFQGAEYAKCRIDRKLDRVLKTPFQYGILRMEFVTHVGWSKEPDWTWSVDCGQVGRTADGRLVAYDWDHCH